MARLFPGVAAAVLVVIGFVPSALAEANAQGVLHQTDGDAVARSGTEVAGTDANTDDVEPAAPRAFRCDGTDPYFFEELQKAGRVGYGETWDETLCNEGVEVYADGATSRWRALRTPKGAQKTSNQDQMLALVMPAVAVGGMGAVFLAAAALAASARLRRRVVLEVPCPSCSASLPIAVDDVSAHHLFCPMCGAACAVDVRGRGKEASAVARLLVS